MGAMHNDLNRCQFMFSDDRRCRNLIETPTSQLCCFHNKAAQKKSAGPEANHPAANAFFDWLSHHPLDTVTHINEALNQVFLLVVANAIPARQAESLVRMARLLLKTVPLVRDEFRIPSLLNHSPGGERFLNEIRPTVLASVMHCDSNPAVLADSPPPQAASPVPEFTPTEVGGPASIAATFRSPVSPSASSAVKNRDAASCAGARSLPRRSLSGRRPAAARKSSLRVSIPGANAPGYFRSPLRGLPEEPAASSALKKLAEQAILDNVRELLRLPSASSKQKAPAPSAVKACAVKGAH